MIQINVNNAMLWHKVDDLIPSQGELKTLTTENYNKLKNEIKKNGFVSPFYVWINQNGFPELLDGHQRQLTLQWMRDREDIEIPDKFPCVEIKADSRERAVRILLALASNYGTITTEGLHKYAVENNIDVTEISENFHFDAFKFETFKDEFCDNDEEEDDGKGDDIPEVDEKEKSYVHRGDVWILGNHRLKCGDSTNEEDVRHLMNGDKADMVFTDPPYNQIASGAGFLEEGRESRKKLKESKNLNNFTPKEFLEVLRTISLPTIYIFCSKNLLKNYIEYFEQNSRNWNLLVMKKKNPIPQKNNTFLADAEYLFCSREKGAYWDNSLDFKYYHRVREINVKPNQFGHPTEKQIEYMEPYLKISSMENQLVLDFFAGSGTTLIACEKTNRKCYGMELDEHYCKVIIERYMKFTERDDVYLLDVDNETKIHISEVISMRSENLNRCF